jgi:acetoacetyl-CoA reductase
MKKNVLITGGTRGIGAAIARKLYADDYHVITNCYQNVCVQIDPNIPYVSFDVSNPEECIRGSEEIREKYGNIDVLVLNAGIIQDAMMHKMSIEQWNAVIQTNLSSCFYVARTFLNAMYEQKFGRIILISSVNAFKGQRGQTNYCATKAGMIGFMKALAQEALPHGVTVNAVAPGYTNTEMVQLIAEPILNKIIDTIPMKRLAEVDEVARCVSFLASEESSYITGQTIHVNGGMYM